MSNIMHMRFTVDTYYGNDRRRYVRFYFTPKVWPHDDAHIRYVSVVCPDRERMDDPERLITEKCPPFMHVMDVLAVAAFDEYGQINQSTPAEKRIIKKAAEWEDDDHLKHLYE